MANIFEYKGYIGSAEVDTKGLALVGRLLFIRDVITYAASNPQELEGAFRDAVDDYLNTCKELGDEPDVPCKGSFNVRVPPALHRDISLLARSKGIKLNEFVYQALLIAARQEMRGPVEHVHQHNHSVTLVIEGDTASARQIATVDQPKVWGESFAIRH